MVADQCGAFLSIDALIADWAVASHVCPMQLLKRSFVRPFLPWTSSHILLASSDCLAHSVGVMQVRKLRRVYHRPDEFERVMRLLVTKKFRSNFRRDMAQRVREWLANPAPRYATPLSPNQFQYV